MRHAFPDTSERLPQGPSSRGSVFSSLRNPNYRLLLAGQVATSSAQWMEQVARGWLVYDLTGSLLLLGLVQATRALPLLVLGIVGGVMADRFDRKRQLILAQNANMILNLVLGVLILTNRVQTWHIFLTALLAGSVMAFQQPARQSLIPDLVDRSNLMNAISLNSGVLNGSRTIAPMIAGGLIAWIGVGGSYVFQALLFFFATIWTAKLQLPPRRTMSLDEQRESFWDSLLGGLRYVRSNPTVLSLLVLALIPIVLAQPYQTMIPVFAKDVFSVGPKGQALMFSAAGVGAMIGAFGLAFLGDISHKAVVLLGGVVAFGAGLFVFAMSPWFMTGLAALAIVGFASTSYRSVNQTLLQLHTEDAYRGRVMSIYLLDRGLAPLGAVLAGILATALGVRTAVAILGLLTVMVALITVVRVPRLRRLS